MKYAIISDIHGNFPAFTAVLADARTQGADAWLLLGDYVNGLPFGNEVTNLLRSLRPAVVIGGNNERYLADLLNQPPDSFHDEQYKMLYHTYRSLTPENLSYLAALPETAVLTASFRY